MRKLTSRTAPATAYFRRGGARTEPADGGVPAIVTRPPGAPRTPGSSRVSRLRLSRAAWAS
jgi:hypothetical protein